MKLSCPTCATRFVIDEFSSAAAFFCPSCGTEVRARVGIVAEPAIASPPPPTLRPYAGLAPIRPLQTSGPPAARPPIARPAYRSAPPAGATLPTGPRRACPACGEKLDATATRCTACGETYQRALRVARGEPATDDPDGFRVEKAMMNEGAIGGFAMIGIAAVWFFLGLQGGRIFFYPPILAVLGLVAIGNGVSRSRRPPTRRRRR